MDIAQIAAQQLHDYDARTPGTIFDTDLVLNEAQAYAIQDEVCRLREQRGEKIIGYKVGCTSLTIQQQLGITQPVFARLFEHECWSSGAQLPLNRFSNFAIEGELAVRLASRPPQPNASDAGIFDAIESVFAVIELHHFTIRRASISTEEFVANNAIHAGFVKASAAAPIKSIESATLQIVINGEEVASLFSSELLQIVVSSTRWLASTLEDNERGLQPGDILLCGSVAPLFPVAEGGHISVTTDRYGSVDCVIS
ncbi:MAG: hypothetical protein AAF512_08205 [Pseudomonadota bacterium]